MTGGSSTEHVTLPPVTQVLKSAVVPIVHCLLARRPLMNINIYSAHIHSRKSLTLTVLWDSPEDFSLLGPQIPKRFLSSEKYIACTSD